MSRFYNTQILSNDGSRAGGTNRFGKATAIYGNYTAVGDFNSKPSGSVFVYVLRDGVYEFLQELEDDEGTPPNNAFGESVAIYGNYLVIGDKSNNNPPGGAVYVYILKNGLFTFSQKIINDDVSANTNFGISVALFGNYLIVGDINNNGTGTSGAVYIYRLEKERFNFFQKLTDSQIATNDKGFSLDMYGNYLIVGDNKATGTPGSDGTVYIYLLDYNIQKFRKIQELRNNDSSGGNNTFGDSVSIHGNYLAIGDTEQTLVSPGKVYIYRLEKGTFKLDDILTSGTGEDDFGKSVLLKGNYLIVGDDDSTARESSGEVYVYILEKGKYKRVYTFSNNDAGRDFGSRLAMYGNNLLVSDDDTDIDGRVYIYKLQRKEPKRVITTNGI